MRYRKSLLVGLLLSSAVACSGKTETQPCAACGGTGLITDELWREREARAGRPVTEPARPDATHPCDVCKGSGKVPK